MGLDFQQTELDWPRALRHLARVVESRPTYKKNGQPRFDAKLTMLEARIYKGERTPRLWTKIMNLEVR